MNFGLRDILEDSICGIPNDFMDAVIDEYLENEKKEKNSNTMKNDID